MTFADAVARLERALREPLPGVEAQAHFAPIHPRTWPPGFNAARARHAAGLLLVFPKNAEAAERADCAEGAHIVLTVRGETPRHPGQVSLPGGVVEPGESFEQAALREAHEEIALDPRGVRVLGALTPLDILVSGFRLHPIVACAAARPALHPADGEVADILEVAVEELMDPAKLVWIQRERQGTPIRVPALRVAGHELWGATAMVVAEFLALLGWTGPSAP